MVEEILKDMLQEVVDLLITDESIKAIQSYGGLKSFIRSSSLDKSQTSITIDPLGPPQQAASGSNTSLSKKFIYQINVESADRMECKEFQRKIEKLLITKKFWQMSGGLEEYFEATERYVDARRYVGYSKLYENY